MLKYTTVMKNANVIDDKTGKIVLMLSANISVDAKNINVPNVQISYAVQDKELFELDKTKYLNEKQAFETQILSETK